MGRLLKADREAKVTQITTRYIKCKKSISEHHRLNLEAECHTRCHACWIRTEAKICVGSPNWTIDDGKNFVWSDKPYFLPQNYNSSIKVWRKQDEVQAAVV